MDKDQAREKTRTMVRAQLSTQDMWDAIHFSREWVEVPTDPADEHLAAHMQAMRDEHEKWRHRAALVAAVVAYARPFMRNEGGEVAKVRIRIEDLPDVHPHHQELHERLMRIRHDILAHAPYEPRQLEQAPFIRQEGGRGEFAYTSKDYWAALDGLTLQEVHGHASYMLDVFGRVAGEASDELRAAGFDPSPAVSPPEPD